jgi:hypothetical protein
MNPPLMFRLARLANRLGIDLNWLFDPSWTLRLRMGRGR